MSRRYYCVRCVPETHASSDPNVQEVHGAIDRTGTCYIDLVTGEGVMPADFAGDRELRWEVGSCPECGAEHDGSADYQTKHDLSPVHIPLAVQALWLARHIEHVHSPHPDVVSDDELRGLVLVRVITLGADEHGDAAFHLDHWGCIRNRKEELSDDSFYDLVDRFGAEIEAESEHVKGE